ncbi:MAG: UPF0182 family protein, partial [Deltaproteobacteria bacterium]
MNSKRAMICLGVLVCILLWAVISLYPDWLWFRNLNFAPVFWTMIMGRFGVATAIWLPMIAILLVNLYAAQRFHRVGESKKTAVDEMPASGRATNAFILAAVLVVSLVIASRGSAQWDMVLSYLNQQPFGRVDPVFNKDIGFYVFSLPFYVFVRKELLVLFLFAGLATFIWYLKDTGLKLIGEVLLGEDRPTSVPKIDIPRRVGKHLLVLGGII